MRWKTARFLCICVVVAGCARSDSDTRAKPDDMAPASGEEVVRDPTEIRTWVKREEVPQITFTVSSEPGKLSVLSGTMWNLNLTLSNTRDVTYAISGEFLV